MAVFQEPFESMEYPKGNKVILALFCIYLVSSDLQIGMRQPFLGAIRFEYTLAIILIILGVFVLLSSRKPLPGNVCFYAGLFVLSMVLQIPLAQNVDVAWSHFNEKTLKHIIVAFLILSLVRNPFALKVFFGAHLLAFFKIGLEGLTGRITGSMMWESQGVMRLHGVTGLFSHPNSHSDYAVSKLPFLYYLCQISPKKVRWIFIAGLVLAANIVVFAGSRAGYIAACFFVAVVCFQQKARMRVLMVLGILFALALISQTAQFKPYVERFGSIFTGEEKEGASTERRIEILEDAVAVFLENPLGVGVYNFRRIRAEEFGRKQDTHNLYLGLLTELGIQGFAAFFLMIYKILRILFEMKASFAEQKSRVMALMEKSSLSEENRKSIGGHLSDLRLFHAGCSIVLTYLGIRLVLGFFGLDLYDVYWWYIVGLTGSLVQMNEVARSKTERLDAGEAGASLSPDPSLRW